MTDREVADGLVAVRAVEERARHVLQSGPADDRRQAEVVTRAALGLRRALEQWIAARACRAVRS